MDEGTQTRTLICIIRKIIKVKLEKLPLALPQIIIHVVIADVDKHLPNNYQSVDFEYYN